jgi:hypothetical protein
MVYFERKSRGLFGRKRAQNDVTSTWLMTGRREAQSLSALDNLRQQAN